jgi:hypothetical protein
MSGGDLADDRLSMLLSAANKTAKLRKLQRS